MALPSRTANPRRQATLQRHPLQVMRSATVPGRTGMVRLLLCIEHSSCAYRILHTRRSIKSSCSKPCQKISCPMHQTLRTMTPAMQDRQAHLLRNRMSEHAMFDAEGTTVIHVPILRHLVANHSNGRGHVSIPFGFNRTSRMRCKPISSRLVPIRFLF